MVVAGVPNVTPVAVLAGVAPNPNPAAGVLVAAAPAGVPRLNPPLDEGAGVPNPENAEIKY